jgi:hypothetical protein
MELLLTKQLKLYKKSAAAGTVACSSGVSGSEKASTVKVSIGPSLATKDGAKRHSRPPLKKDESGYVLTHVVNVPDMLSAFEEELTHLKCCRRRTSKSPSPITGLMPTRAAGAAAVDGLLSSLLATLSFVNDRVTFLST